MKNLLMFVCPVLGTPAFAGGMLQIPVQLLEIENQGRIEFIDNALAATGHLNDKTVRYEKFQTVVVGGDEDGSDYKGALFIFSVNLDSRENGFQKFQCSQFLSVGKFDPHLTRPIDCKKI